ncbi:MAG: FAD-binding oxidoreductase [Candidatus Micrarchaeaceae archaeon]
MDVPALLEKVLGKRKIIRAPSTKAYSKDESYLPGRIPIAAARPENTSDISKIAKICNSSKTSIVVRGGGSSLTGASIPTKGCVVIDMSKFNRIHETRIEDEYVVVEPGVTIDRLNAHLSKYGYFYPPDPASSSFATVGGTISTNAGGLRAIMYGSTKEWVLGLEVVLPNGNVIWTGGRTTKRSVGYDLTSLIVGSEGTLGIVTKAILKIWPKPEATGRIISYYSTMEHAAKAVGKLKKSGIIPLSSEFMDLQSMLLMHEYMGIRFPSNAKYSMITDIAGNRESLPRLLSDSEKILVKSGATDLLVSKSKASMEKMYNARKYLFNATLKRAEKTGKTVVIADIVVPSSSLPAALYEMEKAIRKHNMEVVLFGHIGDGNVHGNIIADPNKQQKAIDTIQMEFGRIALRHGGSVSGEHGIGLAKKALLVEEMKIRKSEYSIKLMKGIKKSFDPNGILNNGKIFD